MNANKFLKGAVIVMTVLLIAGSFAYFYTLGKRNMAVGEFRETAKNMQESIVQNEMDMTTDTMNYDTYKVALNYASHDLADGEQLVHINVGFGSLDRGLKYINDTYGHLNGRPAIQDFARVLKEVFPAEEGWTICHRGGSSFLAFCRGNFSEDKLLEYYNALCSKWHDTPYQVANGTATVDGMALLFCAAVAPECGISFSELRDTLVYKKLALRDLTNCGYVIVTSPDHYICNVEIDETEYQED